jgi:uncharacterized protein (TIGR00730 family)
VSKYPLVINAEQTSKMRICVFCGSSTGRRPEYSQAVRDVAKLLAAQGLGLVYGGGRAGLMGLLADAMLAVGGEVIGVIPRKLQEREIAHTGLTTLHVVETMHERKAKMAELSSAFLALPGGAGTLEEIFEVWTWAQLDFHQKPCAFLNVAGYYDRLFEFIDYVAAEQFLRSEYRRMLLVEARPDLLLNQIVQYTPPLATWAATVFSEPTAGSSDPNVIDVLAWICLSDRRMLATRTRGKDMFYLPGGKRDHGESDWDALFREVQEELGVLLIEATLTEFEIVEAAAHSYPAPTQVRMKSFQASYIGHIKPGSEVEAIMWLSYADSSQCTPAAQQILESLYNWGLID